MSDNRGIGCLLAPSPGLLATVFVVLKLCGVIDWSWWWVLSPMWMTLAAGGLFALVLVWWISRTKEY